MQACHLKPLWVKTAQSITCMQSYLDMYESELNQEAKTLHDLGKEVNDQQFACSTFRLDVPQSRSHLLLLGGMGPLASLHGMRHTLANIEPTMSVTLFQACQIPKRYFDTDITLFLYEALIHALDYCPADKTLNLIVLCNSAHPFMDNVMKRIRENSAYASKNIRFFSLNDSVEKHIALLDAQNVIALQTDFAMKSGVYKQSSTISTLNSIPKLKPFQEDLTQAIEGVKSFHQEQATLSATNVFRALKDWGAQHIILGCTEMPPIIAWLRARADKGMLAYLNSVTFIDPLTLILSQINEENVQ